ncbi:hypothetical protein [Bdellovibrio sp.]|uniref:hypothetical protein n=1 Tax=Bdellovibrio sp. TaxID=28201 RepID=UPI003221DF7D
MKFKELPQGFYQITQARKTAGTVFIQKFENPENLPISIIFPEPIEVTSGGNIVCSKNYFTPENLAERDVEFKTFEEIKKERKAFGARISHVTRGINENRPLKGKPLELALSLLRCDDPDATINSDPFHQGIAKKLEAGEPLTPYEQHMMVDVHLVHARF